MPLLPPGVHEHFPADQGLLTPLFKQYAAIKAEHPQALLLYRLGDFYELFGPDAVHASDLLGLTLTSRACYKDYKVAVRDLYLSTVGCVHYSGEKMAGHMHYPKGAMGVHFVNLTIRGTPDPMKPNILIYEPVGKELRLVAVEWLVPLTAKTNKRPALFGKPFDGPMEGHEPLIPKQYVHYDLHAWLFKDNPLGMFTPTNPNVSCDGYDFSLLEMPTKVMRGP